MSKPASFSVKAPKLVIMCGICAISDTFSEAYHRCEYCGYDVCRNCDYIEEHGPSGNAQYFIDHARIDENGREGR